LEKEEHPDGFHLVKGNAVVLTPQKYMKTVFVLKNECIVLDYYTHIHTHTHTHPPQAPLPTAETLPAAETTSLTSTTITTATAKDTVADTTDDGTAHHS
jgi:hypothetical protein